MIGLLLGNMKHMEPHKLIQLDSYLRASNLERWIDSLCFVTDVFGAKVRHKEVANPSWGGRPDPMQGMMITLEQKLKQPVNL
jgi:hypothetical protein